MTNIKKEFEQLTHNIRLSTNKQFDDSDLWRWVEEKLKESYHKGETRGHYLGYQQAEKSIPSFKDAIDVLKYHLEDNYETK